MSDVNIAVDPGNLKSGWVTFSLADVLGGIKLLASGIDDNHWFYVPCWDGKYGISAIETPRACGMPASNDLFETVVHIGRCIQAGIAKQWTFVDRRDVKLHLCHDSRAKDPNIRRALIDRFGGDDVAIGAVKCPECNGKGWRGRGRPTCEGCGGDKWLHPPGPLKGITSHCWAALAVACYFADTGIIRHRLMETK